MGVLREAAGRDVLCRSSRGDCVCQEGQEELAAFQGCSYTDPQSGRKSEVLDTRLSCALHWSQGIKKSVMFRLSIQKTQIMILGRSKAERLQWYELHPHIC